MRNKFSEFTKIKKIVKINKNLGIFSYYKEFQNKKEHIKFEKRIFKKILLDVIHLQMQKNQFCF
jgi:hypothetical protein